MTLVLDASKVFGELLTRPLSAFWTIDNGTGCAIVKVDMGPTSWHYCGYIAIPKARANRIGFCDGYLDLDVDDTGGITLTKMVDGWCLAGFDCAHAFQYGEPRFRDLNYVRQLVNAMADEALRKGVV